MGLWFVASVGGPVGELSCPEHGSHKVAAAPQMEHGHHGVLPGEVPDGAGQLPHCCTCPGKCSAALGAAVPASAVSMVVDAAIPATTRRSVPILRLAQDPEWILPPANGPPITTRA
jgi:hypothetical protein